MATNISKYGDFGKKENKKKKIIKKIFESC